MVPIVGSDNAHRATHHPKGPHHVSPRTCPDLVQRPWRHLHRSLAEREAELAAAMDTVGALRRDVEAWREAYERVARPQP